MTTLLIRINHSVLNKRKSNALKKQIFSSICLHWHKRNCITLLAYQLEKIMLYRKCLYSTCFKRLLFALVVAFTVVVVPALGAKEVEHEKDETERLMQVEVSHHDISDYV